MVDRLAKTLHLSGFERWKNYAEHITKYSVDAFLHITAKFLLPFNTLQRVLRDQFMQGLMQNSLFRSSFRVPSL